MTAGNVYLLPSQREHWAGRIHVAWQRGVQSIIDTGKLVVDAKRQLTHGEFMAMIERDLPFGVSAAQKLMKIASNTILTNTEFVRHLPMSWGTLYELAKLEGAVLTAKLKDGSVTTDTSRQDVVAWRKAATNSKAAANDTPAVDDTHSDASPPPIKRRRRGKNRGGIIKLPEGHTLSSLSRVGLELERTSGLSVLKVAKQIGLSQQTYRASRDIVQLAARTDLSEDDRGVAQSALEIMDRTKQIGGAQAMVQKIVQQVWGNRRGFTHNDRGVERRIELFQNALAIIGEACSRGTDIEVPHLGQDNVKVVLSQIDEAVRALRVLAARVKLKGGNK